ncbi:unnamed protein product [Ilex paraguariensis]|uniref:Zinc finger PHD-type domain-containing protein n=1 Tax=Ilex paraguariensis TaxID=185542 RepID=A0ABC8UH88_9AQUA
MLTKITVEDASKKHSMHTRLLYGVAYGHTWFGRWGYKFCPGSSGISECKYNRAIENLSSIALDEIICNFGNTKQGQEIKRIVQFYRDLSETQLTTVRDLLWFMLTLNLLSPAERKSTMGASATSSAPQPLTRTVKDISKQKHGKYRDFATSVASIDSRWPARRLQYAAQRIVDVLREKKGSKPGNGGISRKELRDAARVHVGDTGLLDFVMKSLNKVIVGNYLVSRDFNSSTGVLEYASQELANCAQVPELEPKMVPCQNPASAPGTCSDICNDVVYLYNHVLLHCPGLDLVELPSHIVLESNHFVKQWPLKDEEDQSLRFLCRVVPSLFDCTRLLQPGEFIMVPLNATVGELKEAAQSALRDTYCIMEHFEVHEVEDVEEMDREMSIEGILEVWVRGSGMDWGTELMYQGGPNNWTVRCDCGVQEDDGKRMVACDNCDVWQHTHCVGIENEDTIPLIFLCSKCSALLMLPRIDAGLGSGSSEFSDPLVLPPAAELGTEFLF